MKCKIHKQHDCIHNHTNIYLTNVVKNLLQHGLLQLQQLKLRTQWNPVKYKTLLKVRTRNCDLAEKSTAMSTLTITHHFQQATTSQRSPLCDYKYCITDAKSHTTSQRSPLPEHRYTYQKLTLFQAQPWVHYNDHSPLSTGHHLPEVTPLWLQILYHQCQIAHRLTESPHLTRSPHLTSSERPSWLPFCNGTNLRWPAHLIWRQRERPNCYRFLTAATGIQRKMGMSYVFASRIQSYA